MLGERNSIYIILFTLSLDIQSKEALLIPDAVSPQVEYRVSPTK